MVQRSLWLVLAAALIGATAGNAQTAEQRASADEVFRLFGPESPGAAVIVVREGEVVFRAGYGMADLAHGVPITPETVFDIASVSKQFAGFSIAALVQSGDIDLDAEVRDYLPELPDFGHSLTVRHLVHHTSGIRDWPLTLATAGWTFNDVISFDQILRMAWNQRELNFAPGDEYSYSNTGYNLLAEIVQRVTGQSFRAWTDANIFQPLGMASTHFQDNHMEVVPRRAQGYQFTDGAWVATMNGLTAFGSSSLHSSVEDMARWLVNYDERTVGGTSVIERMRTKGVLNSGDTIAYAYGINGAEWRGRELWTHGGSWAGNRTTIVHFPQIRSGVVILSNSGPYSPTGHARRLADIFFGDLFPEPMPEPTGSGSPPPSSSPPELSAGQLQEYAGDWVSDELDTHYVLSVVDGELVADHYRHGRVTLRPSAEDEFTSGAFFLRPVRFQRDEAGSLTDMFVGQGRARNLRFVRR